MQVLDLLNPVDTMDPAFRPMHHVRIHRQLVLGTLFRHPLGTVLDYPESTNDISQPVGHLIQLDPDHWANPMHNTVYSLGAPNGSTLSTKPVKCSLLLDGNDIQVPCKRIHATCT